MDVVISARVPEEELETLKKHKLNVSEIIRASIIEAAHEEKAKEAKMALKEIAHILKKIDEKSFLSSIREDRDESH